MFVCLYLVWSLQAVKTKGGERLLDVIDSMGRGEFVSILMMGATVGGEG